MTIATSDWLRAGAPQEPFGPAKRRDRPALGGVLQFGAEVRDLLQAAPFAVILEAPRPGAEAGLRWSNVLMSSGKYIKGMVCVDEVTYRLERLSSGYYEVIRLSDEVCAGRFGLDGKVRLEPQAVDALLLRRIARHAMQRGKTSWVFHETPTPPAVSANEPEAVETESASLTLAELARVR